MKPTLFVEQDTIDFTLDSGIFLPTEEEIYSQDTIIFANVGSEVVLLRDGEPRLVMNQSENLPCFAIWKAPHTEAEYICLEPWTGIPGDGESPECFDTRKMSRLGSGEIENYRFSVKFPC
jgi:galactose mutarotase-like enzyme